MSGRERAAARPCVEALKDTGRGEEGEEEGRGGRLSGSRTSL